MVRVRVRVELGLRSQSHYSTLLWSPKENEKRVANDDESSDEDTTVSEVRVRVRVGSQVQS